MTENQNEDQNTANQQVESGQNGAQADSKNLSAADAAQLMQSAVEDLRQQWLQSAVRLANALKNGQRVGLGTIEDLRRLRENYEELERARQFLLSAGVAAKPNAAPEGQ